MTTRNHARTFIIPAPALDDCAQHRWHHSAAANAGRNASACAATAVKRRGFWRRRRVEDGAIVVVACLQRDWHVPGGLP